LQPTKNNCYHAVHFAQCVNCDSHYELNCRITIKLLLCHSLVRLELYSTKSK